MLLKIKKIGSALLTETFKTGANQKVRITQFERFNWGAAPHWSAEIGWAIVVFLVEKSQNEFLPPLYLNKYMSFGVCWCWGELRVILHVSA